MDYIIQTQPFVQNSIKGSVTIHGVQGRMSVNLSLLANGYNDSFYFEFVDKDGLVIDKIGSNRPGIFDKIKERLMASGVSEQNATSTANTQADNIYRAVSYGTPSQKYSAMTLFASAYGLTLLPLAQQTGKIVL